MKLSLRILLINFLIVVIILGSSFFVFYNIVYDVLTSLQTRNLRQSANNFVYIYRTLQSETEDDFASLYNRGMNDIWRDQKLQLKNIDFILQLEKNDVVSKHVSKEDIILPENTFNLREFQSYNPYLMLINFSTPDGVNYVYGRAISTDLLNDISQRINSDIALIWNQYPADFSNQQANQKNLYVLGQAVDDLKNKNNFELYIQGTGSQDILATIYSPSTPGGENDLYYLIFNTFAEAGELRSTLQGIFIIIGFVGIALSLIFTMVFTDKFRKQVTELSKATEQTYSGKFDYKIEVKSKDEIGKLGMAFNKMLEELKKKEIAKNEYAEFITLINQNPSLKEISDVALKKIIDTGDFLIGGLYNVDDEITLISSYGLSDEHSVQAGTSEFFKKVIETKDRLELYNEEDLPIVSTGLLDIKIKYLLFLPIVYNNKPIAVLELGSLTKPREEIRDYLEKIKDQLAIGITNARALLQLEKLVVELKHLNEDYQKQNVQIKEQNETLTRLHSELKIQARELEKQKQKAVELTEAKSKFLASMSHELRTPMNSILGLTELMLEKVDLNSRNKERLEVVQNSGKRLMSLINDILDLSKIEAGKVDVLYEDVVLEEIISEVSAAISMLANEKKINYEIVREIDTHTVISTDRGKVVQVLINLLGNAVKYTDSGTVKLKTFVENEQLNFEIVDTGIGIPANEVDVIFEEFRQSNSSNSQRRGGTGLGLAISKKIADILEGSLFVRSKLNEGSTFTFSIPFTMIKSFNDEKNKNVIEAFPVLENGKKPVILISQNMGLAAEASEYLASNGYELFFEKSNALDFQRISEIKPVAVLLNIKRGESQSWDVFKELKQSDHTKNIPIILLSTNETENLAYIFDTFDYLPKPVLAESLDDAIRRLAMKVNKNSLKVVVVDENINNSENIKQFITSKALDITSVDNSEEALIKIEESKPDLVILSLTMPGISGIELCFELKSNSETSTIPVIISVDNELTEDLKKSLSENIEAITQKANIKTEDAIKFLSEKLSGPKQLQHSTTEKVKFNLKPETVLSEPKEISSDKVENSELEIMIVDDDHNTLFTLAEIVQSVNCNSIIAHNGKECLELLEIKTPDLILLDIIMPEMDGFKTISQIKRNKKWSDIPVFAVTAKAMKQDNEIILKHGFTDFIPKPVNTAFVTKKIQSLISQLKTT